MGDGRFGPLRQNDRDGVAATHAKLRERVGKTVRLLLKIPEGERRRHPRLVFPIHWESGAIGGVAAARNSRNIELGRSIPSVLREGLPGTFGQHWVTESQGLFNDERGNRCAHCPLRAACFDLCESKADSDE